MTPRFHERIRQLLSERGKTQALLADYLKVSTSHLSRTLTGERPLEHAVLLAIAEFLETPPADLAAGTEVEDLARPAGAVVQRDTYEDLLQKLQEATRRAAEMESELVSERERRSLADAALADSKQSAGLAQDAAREAANQSARDREARVSAETRAAGAEAQLDAARGTIQTREGELQRVRGELATCQKQGQVYAGQVETFGREAAGLRREVARLNEHLGAANRAVAQNYDAYLQAEQGRQALAQRLQAQEQKATAAAVFTGLIGLGAGLLSGRRGDDE